MQPKPKFLAKRTAQLNPTAQGFTVSIPGAIPPVEIYRMNKTSINLPEYFNFKHFNSCQHGSISNQICCFMSLWYGPGEFFFKEAQPLDKRGNVANNKPLAKRGQTCADQQVVENMVL